MKNFKSFSKYSILLLVALISLMSCGRVQPNYYGVLMQDYGKNGKSDYTKVQGRVSIISPGVELFQVPAWEQRASFKDNEGKADQLHLKASDNTEFTASPLYSYKSIPEKVVDLVFQNSRLGSGSDFMLSLEDNVLEPAIYDIIKEESRNYSTDSLMATGGNLRFERVVQIKVQKVFEEKGLQLINFSSNLDFSKKVKDKINTRNEVDTNISVIDREIAQQLKTNELLRLKTEGNKIYSEGITPALLQKQALDKWDGKLPSTYSGGDLPFVKVVK